LPADPHDPHWLRVRTELRKAVSDSTWDLWLAPLAYREFDGAVLTITAPAETRGWIADRFGRLLQACAAVALGPDVEVDVVAGDGLRALLADRQRLVAHDDAHVRALRAGVDVVEPAQVDLECALQRVLGVVGAQRHGARGPQQRRAVARHQCVHAGVRIRPARRGAQRHATPHGVLLVRP